jgi:hypothetical protein
MGAVRFPPTRVTIPLLATLVYVSLLTTGFKGFGYGLSSSAQALPVYVSLGILLLALQADISRNRSVGRIVYLFGTSGFALLYGAIVYFYRPNVGLVREPGLYIAINVFIVIVFIYDAITRRIHERRNPSSDRWAGDPYAELAADFAGLAILFGMAALLVDLLGPHRFWGQYFDFIRNQQPLIRGGEVELPFLMGTVHTLESADVALALGAAGIALFFIVIVGILSVIPGLTPPTARQRSTQAGNAVQHFLGQLGDVVNPALDRVLLSLRLVFGPLVWFIPAFSIAAFSEAVRDYLNKSFDDQGGGLLGLFFPLSATARENIGPGFLIFLIGVLAIGTVVIAVAVVEHDGAVMADTMRVLGIAGRAIALVLAIAIYSLAFINGVAVFVGLTDGRPFQVGTSGLAALGFGIIFTIYPLLFERVADRAKSRVPIASRR